MWKSPPDRRPRFVGTAKQAVSMKLVHFHQGHCGEAKRCVEARRFPRCRLTPPRGMSKRDPGVPGQPPMHLSAHLSAVIYDNERVNVGLDKGNGA